MPSAAADRMARSTGVLRSELTCDSARRPQRRVCSVRLTASAASPPARPSSAVNVSARYFATLFGVPSHARQDQGQGYFETARHCEIRLTFSHEQSITHDDSPGPVPSLLVFQASGIRIAGVAREQQHISERSETSQLYGGKLRFRLRCLSLAPRTWARGGAVWCVRF